MSTTTIRLPEDLKSRIAVAAKRSGTTPHSFILEAIAEKTEHDERRGNFHDQAEQRYANMIATGMTIPWQDMRAYLEDRVAVKAAIRPKARKLVL